MRDENYNYNQLELGKVAHLSSFISRNTVWNLEEHSSASFL